MFICMQKINFMSNFFRDIVKTVQISNLGNFGNGWPSSSKNHSIKFSCLSACKKKINFITHFSLKMFQINSKLLFWIIWACLVTQNDSTNLKKHLVFLCGQKTNFILHAFLQILQRYCKLVLGTLGMPGYSHPKWYYQLVETSHVYLLAKNQIQYTRFSGNNILKSLQRYANFILGTLGMAG